MSKSLRAIKGKVHSQGGTVGKPGGGGLFFSLSVYKGSGSQVEAVSGVASHHKGLLLPVQRASFWSFMVLTGTVIAAIPCKGAQKCKVTVL